MIFANKPSSAGSLRFAAASLGALSIAMLAGNPAMAQDVAATATAEDDGNVIVVSGFRQSLVEAQEIKRNSANVIESIVAEDIAKMPDLNIAESIQRIPGVAVSREGGEGRNITLRGFAPDFTRTTLNGMEVPASSDGLDSGGFTINAGRSFDFHIFASELFNRIDVQKSQRASIEEGGIAGTVDLYTAHPFDFDGLTIVGSGQAGYNTLSHKIDPRVTFMAADTFADGTIGVLFSAAYSQRTVRQEGFGTVRYTSPYVNGDSWADSDPNVVGTVDGSCGAADPLDCLWAPRLPRADFFGNDQKRLGLTGAVQFRPTDALEITFDWLHSELENDRRGYNSMEWLLTHGTPGNFTGQTPLEFVVGPDGRQIVAASFDDVTSWYESRYQYSESKFDQYMLSGKYEINDKLTLDALGGMAQDKADRTELRFYVRSNPHFYSYDFRDNPNVATVGYGDWDPTDPNNFVDQLNGANRVNNVDKKNYTAKSNLTYEGEGFSIMTGAAYNDRKVIYEEGTGANVSFTPSEYLMDLPVSGFGRGLGVELQPFAVVDFDKLAGDGLFPETYTLDAGRGWEVSERTFAAYIETNAEFPIGSMLLRTNAGLRYVRTKVLSTAQIAGTDVTQTNSYDNYLPSMNLALEITPDVIARFAYARSMTRPGLGSLNIAGPNFGYTTRTVSNLGNPNLEPYQSNDIDLALEWYTPNGGLFAAGFFQKDIVTSLKTDVVLQMIDPVFWPAIYNDPQYDESFNADPAEVPYTFYIPVNSSEGNKVKGFELTANQPFTFLPGMLQYFGIAANFTHVSARDSTGLSPNSYNATLYFDHEDYGMRVSVNKRDDYLLSEPGGNGHLQERKYGPTHVDFSAYYNLSESFTISLEGINITDEKELIYGTGEGDQYLPREYSHTGAQWFLGARFQY
ncbi:TonB-dependent receptor [Croceicoccus ponticola]|uniref:TonB-dependent receptor n=1 Tax=Croceicoccus ponticola TaxID=2217664 RepID=A0A437GZK3_9SPHN|nr:TonB-dependent receptor [Croceicoccus ponticola]RVQ68804.1 TonB-dependent receptor [Croceicoccus ponticola]